MMQRLHQSHQVLRVETLGFQAGEETRADVVDSAPLDAIFPLAGTRF